MLRNYALMSYRTAVKNAGYSLISLLGLSVGLAAFVLILAYVRFETSYDRFFERKDRIFRLLNAAVKPGETPAAFVTWTPDPVATLLKTEFPEVRRAARVMKQLGDPAVLSFEGRAFAQSVLIADQDFLDIFSFPFVRGDRTRAQRISDALGRVEQPYQRGRHTFLRAGIVNYPATREVVDVLVASLRRLSEGVLEDLDGG